MWQRNPRTAYSGIALSDSTQCQISAVTHRHVKRRSCSVPAVCAPFLRQFAARYGRCIFIRFFFFKSGIRKRIFYADSALRYIRSAFLRCRIYAAAFKNKYRNGIISLEISIKRKKYFRIVIKTLMRIFLFFNRNQSASVSRIKCCKNITFIACFYIFRNHRTDRHKLIFYVDNRFILGGSFAVNFKIFRRNGKIRTFQSVACKAAAQGKPSFIAYKTVSAVIFIHCDIICTLA